MSENTPSPAAVINPEVPCDNTVVLVAAVGESSTSDMTSVQNIETLFQVGDGRWTKDKVAQALGAANNSPNRAATLLSSAPGQANVPKIASLIISESKVPEAPDFPGPSSLSSPEQPILKKQKKAKSTGVQIPSTALLASSDVSDSSSPSSKQVDGKKPKKVNTCARCRRQKQGCKDCVFADVFTTETQSDYDKASELFGIKSMQNRLSLVQPQDRLQVREAIMWRVAAWANDPLHGPLGRFRNLEREAAAAAASAAAARLAARSLLTSSY
ncbi:uncharacterized protein LOC123447959 isoform X2 [Hordeum vulgare subsp. vulgare]|uniref:uncharacterized protein LOC123447959 isoform X2 n=1 Tax=Hordeum vulgare subsp. vulgare TaxID=112509 RepID=UPI001D1A32EA|nr:uncharacterized protein LOC123447959 isoform X2 [Hordeum vulgare subsp. vulgare]